MRDDEDEEEEETPEQSELSTTSVTPTTSPGASPLKRAIISMPKVILKDSSGAPKPQIVLSPTAKYISTGKTGSKAQVFTLSLAPGAESKMIQAGGTVKIGNTVLRITPKTGASAPEASAEEKEQPAETGANAESANEGESSESDEGEGTVQIIERKIGSLEELEEEKSDGDESEESRPSSAASKASNERYSDPDYMVCLFLLELRLSEKVPNVLSRCHNKIEFFFFFEKSVSYQKKDGRGHARLSSFWYDNNSDRTLGTFSHNVAH